MTDKKQQQNTADGNDSSDSSKLGGHQEKEQAKDENKAKKNAPKQDQTEEKTSDNEHHAESAPALTADPETIDNTSDLPEEDIKDFSAIVPGIIVRVHEKIRDITPKGETKERVQVFEGTVIAKKHGNEPGATITVRKRTQGNIAVEKIFPIHSPVIKKLEVIKKYKIRRSKLYFLRNPRKKMKESKVIKQVNA